MLNAKAVFSVGGRGWGEMRDEMKVERLFELFLYWTLPPRFAVCMVSAGYFLKEWAYKSNLNRSPEVVPFLDKQLNLNKLELNKLNFNEIQVGKLKLNKIRDCFRSEISDVISRLTTVSLLRKLVCHNKLRKLLYTAKVFFGNMKDHLTTISRKKAWYYRYCINSFAVV